MEDIDSKPIDSATVDATQNGISQNSAITNPSGNYLMTDVLCGTYDVIASASGFVSSGKQGIVLLPEGSITVDFTGADGLVLGSTCETDCTYAGDNTIHQECDGINNCAFFDATAKTVCNLAQPGWIRDYDENNVIECAEGAPQAKVEVKAKITCDEDNLIKTTKIVTYKGKLVKLVVVTCG